MKALLSYFGGWLANINEGSHLMVNLEIWCSTRSLAVFEEACKMGRMYRELEIVGISTNSIA